MHLTLVDYALWLGSGVVMAGVLAAMYSRKLHKTYPYFFAYAILQVVSVPLMFWLSTRFYAVYYYAYYGSLIASVVISIAIFWEIFRNALKPHEGLRRWAFVSFWWGVVFLSGVIVLMTFARGPSPQGPYANWISSSVSATRVAQCALILFLLLFRRHLGISRGHVIFGIALGFGIFAAVNMLIASGIRFNGLTHGILWQVNSLAYLLASVVWLTYTLRGSTQLGCAPKNIQSRLSNGARLAVFAAVKLTRLRTRPTITASGTEVLGHGRRDSLPLSHRGETRRWWNGVGI